jgi:hypothetical protein
MAVADVADHVAEAQPHAQAETLAKSTTIFYMKPQSLYEKEKPYFLNVPVEEGSDLAQTNVNYTRISVSVTDIRGQQDKFTLDEHGFQLRTFHSKLSYDDFDDPKKLTSLFYPEVQAFLRASLGATDALTFDYQVCASHLQELFLRSNGSEGAEERPRITTQLARSSRKSSAICIRSRR